MSYRPVLHKSKSQALILVPSLQPAMAAATPLDKHTINRNEDESKTSISMENKSHSSNKLDEIHELTDLVRYRINEDERHENTIGSRCLCNGSSQCERHKKGDGYGNEMIVQKRTKDLNGGLRQTDDFKFKCVWDAHEWMEAIGRTIGSRVRAVAVIGLLLMTLASGSALPAPKSRVIRSDHHTKSVRSYLETFGYLNKAQPEVGNLLLADKAQFYEDDFRIAIKTFQEFGGIPVTGIVDEATKKLMSQKRCGRPDREQSEDRHRHKRFAVQGEKWKHTNLTWSLSQYGRPSKLNAGQTRLVLKRALDVWAQASRLTFTEVNSNQADIVVSFASGYHNDSYPFDGRGSILAHAFFPGSGRGGDAHFDDDELWLLQFKDEDEDGTSLFAVAAHEFGHSLGLSHSSVKGALMFPWYQGIQPNFVLPEDDRNGIQQMYGPKENRRWGIIPNYKPAETPPTTTTTTTTTTTVKPYYPHHKDPYGRHPNYPPNNYPYNRPNNYPNKYPVYHPVTEPPRSPTHWRPTEATTHSTTYRYRHYTTPHGGYPTHPPRRATERPPPRRTRLPLRPVRPTQPSDKPDSCNTSYDAVTLIRGELFIFKNRYHWRIGKNGRYSGYPIEIVRMWPDLPNGLTHVDAVYERPNQNIVFFIGKQFYVLDLNMKLVRGYPRPLTDLGLPEYLERLDAAMVWGYNGKTYFYSGSSYWKFDEDERRVELDYPRDMSMWKGVGKDIDSVFQWKDGKTYFFKGKMFWKFNDLQMQVEHYQPQPSGTFWMNCPVERAGRAPYRGEPRSPYRGEPQAPFSTLRSPSSASTNLVNILSLLSSTLLVLINYVT